MKLHHYSLIFLIVAMVFLLRINIETRTYKNVKEEKDYLQQSLNKAVSDAMIHFPEEEAISGLQVNKDRLVNKFLDSIYGGLGISNSSEKEEFKFYLPIISITSMDGFHIYYTDEYRGKDQQTLYRKQWSEKFPFYYEDDDFIYRFTLTDVISIYDKNNILDTGKGQRIFTLNYKDLIYFEDFSDFRRIRPNSFLLNENKFDQIRKLVISSSMEKEMKEHCNKHNEIARNQGISYVFNLPLASSEWQRAVEGPGLLLLFQAYPLKSIEGEVYNRFIVASSQIKKRQPYVLEVKEGGLTYHKKDCRDLASRDLLYTDVFYSAMEAAAQGAYPCLVCLE